MGYSGCCFNTEVISSFSPSSPWNMERSKRLEITVTPEIKSTYYLITWYRLECMLVVGLSQAWASRGFLRRRWISAVLGWWLGFACLLRLGELLNLRVGDISLPEGTTQEEESLGAVVIIRQPKTRRVWRQQFVVSRDTVLVQWLVVHRWQVPWALSIGLITVPIGRQFFPSSETITFRRMPLYLGILESWGCHTPLSHSSEFGRTSISRSLEASFHFGTLST